MKITNLSKAYGNKLALDDINLEFNNNGMVFILGDSGSGKTTLLNLIGGIDSASSGSITFDNLDLCKLDPRGLDDYRNKNIGFIFQEYSLFNELTVAENISITFSIIGKSYDEALLKEYFQMVDLNYEEFKNKKVYRCSGGERQRIAITRALVKDSKIILCDEPTGALDNKTSKDILDILKKLSLDRLVIVVSHDEELAKSYADRIINIVDGRISSDTSFNEGSEFDNNALLEKSHLALFHMLKLALNSFRLHTKRFIFVIISLIISMTLFMTSLNVTLINQKEVEYDYVENNNMDIIKIDKYLNEVDKNNTLATLNFDSLFIKQYIHKHEAIDINDYTKLAGLNQNLSIFFIEEVITAINKEYNSIYEIDALANNDFKGPSGYSYMDYDKALNELEIVGAYPRDKNEALISSDYFNLFKKFGYRLNDKRIDIASYSDLIGQEIKLRNNNSFVSMKVCGIYEANDIKRSYKDESNLKHDYYNSVFLSRDDYNSLKEEELRNEGLYLLIDNTDDLKRIIDFNHLNIKNKNDDGSYISYLIIDSNNGFAKINGAIYNATIFRGIFLIFTIILLIISILNMSNTFSLLINKQRKQIGILKALGVKRNDINFIYASIAFIIGLIVLIFASALSAILLPILNGYFLSSANISLLSFKWLGLLIMMLIIIATLLLALALPLIRLNRKTPAEVIIEGKAR